MVIGKRGTGKTVLIRHCFEVFRTCYPEGTCIMVGDDFITDDWKARWNVKLCSWEDVVNLPPRLQATPNPTRPRLIAFLTYLGGPTLKNARRAMTQLLNQQHCRSLWTILEAQFYTEYPPHLRDRMDYLAVFQHQSWQERMLDDVGPRILRSRAAWTQAMKGLRGYDSLFLNVKEDSLFHSPLPYLRAGSFLYPGNFHRTTAFLKLLLARQSLRRWVCPDVANLIVSYTRYT